MILKYKTKIILNAVSAKTGGSLTHVKNLIAAFRSINPLRYEFIFTAPCSLPLEFNANGSQVRLRLIRNFNNGLARFLWDQVTLRIIIKKEKADLLISTSDFGMFLPPVKQILWIRNSIYVSRLYKKIFLKKKTLFEQIDYTIRLLLLRLSIYFSDLIFVASDTMRSELSQWLGDRWAKRILVNPFGVSTERFDGHEKYIEGNNDAKTILHLLFVSEYGDYKNLTTLLKALLILKEKNLFEFKLLTTADPRKFPSVPYRSRLLDLQLASDSKISSSIEFAGDTPYEEIPRFYQRSDLFIFPSLTESFGHPLVEAMSSGLPILASDIPICREICGNAAIYFDPLNPEALAEKIIALQSNPSLCRELGVMGRKRVESHFRWDRHFEKLFQAMETLLR